MVLIFRGKMWQQWDQTSTHSVSHPLLHCSNLTANYFRPESPNFLQTWPEIRAGRQSFASHHRPTISDCPGFIITLQHNK
jgi:hypothetical protein